MNNRGFTLVELLVSLVILTLVMSIAAYSIISTMNASKEELYNDLVENIKDSVEVYYQECYYARENIAGTGIVCSNIISLGELVNYGYLQGNSTDSHDKFVLVNPKTGALITSCQIRFSYNNGKITVTNLTTVNSDCPNY